MMDLSSGDSNIESSAIQHTERDDHNAVDPDPVLEALKCQDWDQLRALSLREGGFKQWRQDVWYVVALSY